MVDEVVLSQQAGDRAFSTHVQLLETKDGERLVRLAYATTEQEQVRRGPVTLSVADMELLRKKLAGHSELAEAFGLGGAKRRRPSVSAPRRRASPG